MTAADFVAKRPYAPKMAPDARRDQILDAVLDVICEHGVGAVTVDGIARAIGVTRPVVYGLFTDSDHMLRESLKREEARAFAQLSEVLPLVGSAGPEDMKRFIEAYLHAILDAPKRWRAILLPTGYPPAFLKRLARAQSALLGQFEAIARASVPDQDTDFPLLARALVALLFETGRIVLTEGDEFGPERIANFTAAITAKLFAP